MEGRGFADRGQSLTTPLASKGSVTHARARRTDPRKTFARSKMRLCSGRAKKSRADSAHAMSFLALVAHQVIELRHRLEIMKVRSTKERGMLYLDLNAKPDGKPR